MRLRVCLIPCRCLNSWLSLDSRVLCRKYTREKAMSTVVKKQVSWTQVTGCRGPCTCLKQSGPAGPGLLDTNKSCQQNEGPLFVECHKVTQGDRNNNKTKEQPRHSFYMSCENEDQTPIIKWIRAIRYYQKKRGGGLLRGYGIF